MKLAIQLQLYFTLLIILLSCSLPPKQQKIVKQNKIELLGKCLLKGMHDTIGGEQANGLETVNGLTGNMVDIWSSDFGFSVEPNDSFRRREDLIAKAQFYHRQGTLITLSYHQCNPKIDEPCSFAAGVTSADLSSIEWRELLTDNTALNKRWKVQMDKIASYLKQLESVGVRVLFRPYHEANIPGFWWASNPEVSKQLWIQLYSYFQNHHKLKNMLWVWSVSYHPKYWENVAKFYPGDQYVDVVGVDIYPPAKKVAPDFSVAWSTLRGIAPKKILALTEVSVLPSISELESGRWAYFVPWGKNMLVGSNSKSTIKQIFSYSHCQ